MKIKHLSIDAKAFVGLFIGLFMEHYYGNILSLHFTNVSFYKKNHVCQSCM